MAEDNKTVVVRDDSGGGAGWIAGLIVLLLIVAVLWTTGVFQGGNDDSADININTSVPTGGDYTPPQQ